MRRAFLVALLPCLASAQPEVFFRSGKPLNYREQEIDRRFGRTLIAQMLKDGTQDPNCAQVLGGLLTLLAEAGPYLHKRDEEFKLDDSLLAAASQQLNTPQFPATLYFSAMVRRVLIDRALPKEWLATAEQLKPVYPPLDVGKLRMLADGLKPIDSFLFTLEALRARHEEEVVRVTSISNVSEADFRDRYLDREVAWNHFMLIDIVQEKVARGDDDSGMVAMLQWVPPHPDQNKILLVQPTWKPPLVKVIAKLSTNARQYADLYTLNKGHPMMVKGRFFDMSANGSELKIKDAVILEDRNFATGIRLANPGAVAACPAAINDLQGVAGTQLGGFGQRF